FFFQAEDGIRDLYVTGVQTCALPISAVPRLGASACRRRRPGARAGGLLGRRRCGLRVVAQMDCRPARRGCSRRASGPDASAAPATTTAGVGGLAVERQTTRAG